MVAGFFNGVSPVAQVGLIRNPLSLRLPLPFHEDDVQKPAVELRISALQRTDQDVKVR